MWPHLFTCFFYGNVLLRLHIVEFIMWKSGLLIAIKIVNLRKKNLDGKRGNLCLYISYTPLILRCCVPWLFRVHLLSPLSELKWFKSCTNKVDERNICRYFTNRRPFFNDDHQQSKIQWVPLHCLVYKAIYFRLLLYIQYLSFIVYGNY